MVDAIDCEHLQTWDDREFYCNKERKFLFYAKKPCVNCKALENHFQNSLLDLHEHDYTIDESQFPEVLFMECKTCGHIFQRKGHRIG